MKHLWLTLIMFMLGHASPLTADTQTDSQPQTPTNSQAIGGDFTLTDQHGKPFRLDSVRGKLVLLFFGYTHCPDVCPDTLGKMARVMRELDQDASQVQVLFITVDPERDTVAQLNNYVPFFSPSALGLTGTPAQIRAVVDQYQADFKLNKTESQDGKTNDFYTVDHTASVYLLDRTGKVDSMIPYGLPAEHILQAVRQLLAASEAPDQPRTASKPDADTPAVALRTADSYAEAEQPDRLALALHDLQGQPYSLQTQAKPVMINFWATWCPPCRAELPALNRAYQQLAGDGLAMLAINVGDSSQAVSRFLHYYPIDFPVVLDEAGNSMKHWPIKGLPTTIILDHQGKLLYRVSGEKAWDSKAMLDEIRTILKIRTQTAG